MIGKQVVGSDAFKKLSTGAQALYMQLVLEADDDGFVANVNSVIASNKRYRRSFLNELVLERFILSFSSGVVAIKHWLIMNSIRKDRYKPTAYQKELKTLVIKPNLSYTEISKDKNLVIHSGNQMATICQPFGSVSKDKISKDKIIKIDPRAHTREDRIYLTPEEEKIVEMYQRFNPSWNDSIQQESLALFLGKHTIEDFEKVLERAKRSNYLTGKTGGPVMKLDWVLDEGNYLSVMSGKYDSWEGDSNDGPKSFDPEEFFQRAVSRGLGKLGK